MTSGWDHGFVACGAARCSSSRFSAACGGSERFRSDPADLVRRDPARRHDRGSRRNAARKNRTAATTIKPEFLPTDASQQREQLVRRLGAEDSSIDIIGMDVIWTGEFANAGWVEEWTGPTRRSR